MDGEWDHVRGKSFYVLHSLAESRLQLYKPRTVRTNTVVLSLSGLKWKTGNINIFKWLGVCYTLLVWCHEYFVYYFGYFGRYGGQLSFDAITDWLATSILGLPRILYYSKESMVIG